MTSEVQRSQAMRGLWVYYLFWESLPILKAHPVLPTISLGTNESLRHWELNWLKYIIGLLGITITAFTLVGCLCCRRNRRPKGFQDCSGSINKEFKDGNSIDNDSSMPQLQGLELQVPTSITTPERIQFEPLPVERFIPDVCILPRPKPPPPSPSIFEEVNESDRLTLQNSYNEWFQNTDLHLPREKLKYLREIGHGWFGKVVEGCAELQGTNLEKCNAKNGNVVVRILTEEATTKEKAWFLGEATPYFKLRHRNILSLFGSCLEADPYLLLFESCPLGDLKGFLHTNHDPQSREALINENMPTRIAIEIGAGLRHMHQHRLTHTDLSARNCLVASDLSIKLGDYGTGVEKYPEDYYILGDRALPIRWSAPETIECTKTTIETREITPRANLWSYGVLLWEIAMWGKRPYDELEDEQVIEMLLSSKSGMKPIGSQLLLQNNENCPSNLLEAIKTCLILESDKRFPLERVRHVLLKDQLEAETSEFEQRWETLRPNTLKEQTRSASLQDLRGSIDSEQWQSLTQTSFRLGPEEPVKNVPGGLIRSKLPFRDSDSETEEESWRGRVERGAYTEKVKQKSKSVADLMVLVHIEPDSDADLSLGPQMPMIDKTMSGKKRLSVTGSDGDLPSAVFDDQFDLALRKLRDPLIPSNNVRGPKSVSTSNMERPKLLTLTMDQGQTPILRLTFDSTVDKNIKKEIFEDDCLKPLNKEAESNTLSNKEHVLRLLATRDLNQSWLRYDKKINTTTESYSEKLVESRTSTATNEEFVTPACFSNNFQITDLDDDIETDEAIKEKNDFVQNNSFNANTWNDTMDPVLKQNTTSFNSYTIPSPIHKNDGVNDEMITPSPQSRTEYSTEDAEDEFSNAEDLPGLSKRHLPIDEEDDRKRMSTPDDERSSDSGFRDKESCEEEESPLPGPLPNLISSQSNTPKSTTTHDSAEEEQLRILFELDTILDAEYYGILNDSLDPNSDKSMPQKSDASNLAQKDNDVEAENSDTMHSSSDTTGETQKEIVQIDKLHDDDANLNVVLDSQITDLESGPLSPRYRSTMSNQDVNVIATRTLSENGNWVGPGILDNNEDEDSSTMSLRSDNSYVSFGMDEEFVAAIRNELREKLPRAQMTVVEAQELHDEDEPSLISDIDNKNWDEIEEDLSDRSSTLDISIRYNTYGTPLSPILEERESTSISESTNITKDDSRDTSIASKGGSNSLSEDDVLLIDTQTNRATLVEGISSHSHNSQELMNHVTSNDNRISNIQQQQMRLSFSMDKQHDGSSSVGVPLPSPEDEACKWQQQISTYPMLPPQLQDNLMSTSFANEQDWNSDKEDQDEHSESLTNEIDEEDENEDENDDNEEDDDDDECEDGMMEEDNEDDDDDDDDNDDDDDDEDDDDDDDDSSSSGEFVWQQYGATHLESHETENSKEDKTDETNNDLDEDLETEDEELEFTPSAWDATLAPHRSALRSPDKTIKSGDQKKSVWFKKQRYHCVYEYPKETPPIENQTSTTSVWEPTSYADWEEMIDNIDRLNFQPMDYFESNNTRGDEEFYVSSSNRPFQFQSGNGKYVSQFFPGASGNGAATTPHDTAIQDSQTHQNDEATQQQFFSDRQQLGELRHTRDRLKLNLLTSPPSSSNGDNRSCGSGSNKTAQLCNSVKQGIEEKIKNVKSEESGVEGEKTRLEEMSTKIGEDVRLQSEPFKTADQEVMTTNADFESHVKSSPSDGQRNITGLEFTSNCDNFDVE
ncbi:PREDICTED: uncharacterized protein LOC105361376 [Ceratosolen solmsi marchali]|uniref:Uncharacterized protein LOC105361376 n=1 Tax=Ceratosolen solmsi marchali TaxID=326594 RepID=A0AAJ6YEY4_9HYME|nr:PREDICTED: uncharacterized protein LOC105361376 [Ceratosolen solmsi marchali]